MPPDIEYRFERGLTTMNVAVCIDRYSIDRMLERLEECGWDVPRDDDSRSAFIYALTGTRQVPPSFYAGYM